MKKILVLLVIFLTIAYSLPTDFYNYFKTMKEHQTKFVSCKLVEKNCEKIPWYLGDSKGSVQYRCGENVHVRKYGNKCIAHKDYFDPRSLGNALRHVWYDFLKLSKPKNN
jgi:hypothetical protein